MKNDGTIILSRSDVKNLLSHQDCLKAVEHAFRLYGEGKTSPPGILGVHVTNGAFHIKAGVLTLGRNYFVMKCNGNFPENKRQHNLPTIQGLIIVADADNGRVLAVMDSIEITIIRTGAATGVAAKYLSKENSKVLTIIGAGNQGRISAMMLMQVRKLKKIFVYDLDRAQAKKLAEELQTSDVSIKIQAVPDWKNVIRESDIVVTCTPSKRAFLTHEDISPGTFIAAVGSDNDDKQELEASLLMNSTIICDITSQCATIGELHHAIARGMLTKDKVHAELSEVIAGKKVGRSSEDEIIVFDSTGMALQDVTAAAMVYERASENTMKRNFND